MASPERYNSGVTPDFRYHVASLSATFLALGIGILIGTAFVGAKVVDRQTMMMNRLSANFGELRKETKERELTEQTLQQAVPQLMKNTLVGERVLVIQIGSVTEAVDQVNKTLALTGADTASLSLPSSAWLKRNETERDSQAKALAEALPLGRRDTLTRLQDDGLLTGVTENRFLPHQVILVGGESEELARTRDLPLLKALRGARVRTVVVELYETTPSLIPLWGGEAEASVDCINRAVGWLALVVALEGTAGNFGLKPGAIPPELDKLTPTSPLPLPSPTPQP